MTTTGAGPLRLEPAPGRSLRDLLFERGVEFPCAGVSQCGGCKVRVISGEVPITDDIRAVLTPEELNAGWRLGCMAESSSAVVLEIAQWSVRILDDRAAVPFEPAEGLGVVVDVGTTTLVAQLVDRATGAVLKVETALDPQARHGADLMSRIRHELAEPGPLTRLIRDEVGAMLGRLSEGTPMEEVLLVGNTAMHHLFCGLSVEPLAAVPFRSPTLGERLLDGRELGLGPLAAPARLLPVVRRRLGGERPARGTGGDRPVRKRRALPLLDLGTNGEIAVGDRAGIQCTPPRPGRRSRAGGWARGCARRRRDRPRSDRQRCMSYSVIGDGPPHQGSAGAAWWTRSRRCSSSAGSSRAVECAGDGSRSRSRAA